MSDEGVEFEERGGKTAAARRVRLSLTLAGVGLVVAGAVAATWMLVGAGQAQEEARLSRPSANRPPEPIRLDTLRPSRRRDVDEGGAGRARVARVAGVGTGEFAVGRGGGSERPRGGGSEHPRESVVDVDGAPRPGDEDRKIAPDAEVKHDLAALERENARIEAALRHPSVAASGTGELIWPVRGPLNSPFGQRWGRLHAGIDIGVPTGTPVKAADSGRVAISGWMGGYGNHICLQHTRSLTTCYAHNSGLGVRRGESVRQGQVIARSGSTGNSTGPHVHFETRVNGTPVDPMRYL